MVTRTDALPQYRVPVLFFGGLPCPYPAPSHPVHEPLAPGRVVLLLRLVGSPLPSSGRPDDDPGLRDGPKDPGRPSKETLAGNQPREQLGSAGNLQIRIVLQQESE